ncbi:MAG: long-chain fatty acid--CoA ligase [Acidimicrobiales bacterium]
MNLASVIETHPGDAPALISRGKVTTYGELRRQVGELRYGLKSLGVEPGDRVAIMAANNWFFVVAYLGILGSGGVAVPLNPGSPTAELSHQLDEIGAKVAIIGPSSRLSVEGIDRTELGLEHLVATESAHLADAVTLETLFTGTQSPIVDRGPDDLAVLMFTSGTGGSPKAAMLTHGNLLANLDQIQRHPGRRVVAEDVSLGVLPLHHIFGLNVVLGLSLLAGASVVLIERFDPSSALETIAAHKVSVVAGAPPMYGAWLSLPTADAECLRGVRLAVSGAAPLGADAASAFGRNFGVDIYEGYGLTEASPTVTSSVVGGRCKPGSIGVPLAGVEVRLVDESADDVFPGDAGEIWVRGPNVFAGYWDQAEATAAALTSDGWLRTGDVAVVDDEGWLFIVDRAKDVIIVSGFNVFPAEVEQALASHPGIAEVAVIGVAHPHTGEAVKAFVVPSGTEHFEEDELIDYCASRLARYKCPSKVMFVDELPHGRSGKLLRRELRESSAGPGEVPLSAG